MKTRYISGIVMAESVVEIIAMENGICLACGQELWRGKTVHRTVF